MSIEGALDDAVPAQHHDRAKLRQSVIHLLRNAVRFSPERARVAVATRLEDGEVKIEIRDRGPAFDVVEASEIYEIEAAARGDLKRARTGSHRAFSADVALAAYMAGSESPVRWVELARAALISTTLAALARLLPSEVFRAMAQMGWEQEAIDHASLITDAARRSDGANKRSYSSIAFQNPHSEEATLNIVVCTKQVPDSAATLKVDEPSNVSWGDAALVINPWDSMLSKKRSV